MSPAGYGSALVPGGCGASSMPWEANGYSNHGEWLRDWRSARNDEFFVLGSRDETAGCQLCVTTVDDDGSLTLRLQAA